MAIFKCKMCGGDLEINESVSFAECEYCGAKQTVPKVMDENLQNLFNRANTLRIKSEFDKAEKLYEKLIQADSIQAEAYWGLILCKYGIEYVDDPQTFKKIPTCHRASYDSVIADDDYKLAIENADASQKALYEEQAKEIDRIQKEILALAQKEESYDVFICYKETDSNGQRTQDSVIANDIYYQLTQEGFKVFYAAITLEGKLGSAYEPIIFAALNSAKVMLAIGTKPEHFNAVWVKNEWSRFLKIIKKDRSKLLIPCYRDMDAYELPEEFAHLQAQDMGKIGFVNDVVRGIKKVVQNEAPKATVIKETVVTSGNANTAPLLKRAFMFLEDGDWDSADEYCEKVLDLEPENAMAYIGKLMVELKINVQDSFKDLENPFDDNNNYQKALRFADDKLKTNLTGYIDYINTRNKNARLEETYQKALDFMNIAHSEYGFKKAADEFSFTLGYKDAEALYNECIEKAEICRKDEIYYTAITREDGSIPILNKGIELFKEIPGWRDADEQIKRFQKRIEELEREEKERKIAKVKIAKRNRIISVIIFGIIALIVTIVLLINYVFIPNSKYKKAIELMNEGKYTEAITAFEALEGYRDSVNKIDECNIGILDIKYNDAVALMELGENVEAITMFENLDGYKDSNDKIIDIKYNNAIALMNEGKYTEAMSAFIKELVNYKDSANKINECIESIYNNAIALMDEGKYQEAINLFSNVSNHKKSYELKSQCYLEGAKKFYANKDYYTAITWYEKVNSYDKNAEFYLDACYNYGVQQTNSGSYINAIHYLSKAGNRSGVKEQMNAAKYGYVNANKNNNDSTTFEYLKELKAAKYKDSASIYKELYAWKVDIVANNNQYDETTDMTSISKYSKWYFHVSLSGGEPGAETKMSYIGYFPDSDSYSDAWDYTWYDGKSGTCWFYYNTPLYGDTGTFRLKVFDGNGNVIGEKSVRLTG